MDTEDNSSLSGLVFLDTEVFVRSNFQYDRGLLAAFRQQYRRVAHVILRPRLPSMKFVRESTALLKTLILHCGKSKTKLEFCGT
jgi:hypothetical protein